MNNCENTVVNGIILQDISKNCESEKGSRDCNKK